MTATRLMSRPAESSEGVILASSSLTAAAAARVLTRLFGMKLRPAGELLMTKVCTACATGTRVADAESGVSCFYLGSPFALVSTFPTRKMPNSRALDESFRNVSDCRPSFPEHVYLPPQP